MKVILLPMVVLLLPPKGWRNGRIVRFADYRVDFIERFVGPIKDLKLTFLKVHQEFLLIIVKTLSSDLWNPSKIPN